MAITYRHSDCYFRLIISQDHRHSRWLSLSYKPLLPATPKSVVLSLPKGADFSAFSFYNFRYLQFLFYCHCDNRSACKAGALFATAACAPRAIARQGMHAPQGYNINTRLNSLFTLRLYPGGHAPRPFGLAMTIFFLSNFFSL